MCQTVSKLENLHDPADTTRRLNFLSTNGLQCYGNNGCEETFNDEIHANQPIPNNYTYDSTVASSMLMQWYGEFWVASDNGNERWFIPANNSKWRKSAVNVLATADTTALGSHGTKYIYGYAWDNPDYGMVMYQAGHNYNPNASGNASDHVTALRAFFNYLFQVTKVKGHHFDMKATAPECFVLGQPNAVTSQITAGWDTGPFTFHWSSTVPGTFANPNSSSTTFTPNSGSTQEGWITIEVTDACGRKKFDKFPINMFRIGVAPDEVSCYGGNDASLHAEVLSSCEPVSYLWSTGDTTQDIDSLYTGIYFVQVTDGVGNELTDWTYVYANWNDVYCNVLPVELAEFYGENQGAVNHLYWTTLSEVNNSHFHVMRSSDGIYFEKIGDVEGHGTTSEVSHYEFVDPDPYIGLNYYRLEQVDFDGAKESSPVITVLVKRNGEASILVWPNPTNGQLNVSVMGEMDGDEMRMRVYNMAGTVIAEQQVESHGSFQTTFDLSGLSGGVYLLEVWNDYHQFSRKIIVQ
jgi:hypothetical protein